MPSGDAPASEAPGAAQALVAEAVAVLHANGAGSERTARRAQQVATAVGQPSRLELGWNASSIDFGPTVSRFAATPSVIGMNRVLGVDHALDRLSRGESTVAQTRSAVRAAAALPPANIWVFALACAVGASCLAVIFGIQHGWTVLLIAVSAAAGAFLRRGIGSLGGSNFWQVGLAALLAGVLGAVATNAGLSSSLRLAAVCPCMVLVPGPHLLNAAFDLAALRIPLGLARLAFATLTLLSIGAGLLAGLALGGARLLVDPAGREIPLWLDAGAAGVVAVCYGIFYAAPLRILVWPFAVGAAMHALRWIALESWHLPPYVAAGLACLVAAAVLLPVSRRFRLPFSAIGFAAVVSLMPGVLIFRALAGLAALQSATGAAAQQVLVATINDANTAWLTIFAMAIGFCVPAAVAGRMRRFAESRDPVR
jgi:uncharacterized membrane protein YjjP (DUF1212 family)